MSVVITMKLSSRFNALAKIVSSVHVHHWTPRNCENIFPLTQINTKKRNVYFWFAWTDVHFIFNLLDWVQHLRVLHVSFGWAVVCCDHVRPNGANKQFLMFVSGNFVWKQYRKNSVLFVSLFSATFPGPPKNIFRRCQQHIEIGLGASFVYVCKMCDGCNISKGKFSSSLRWREMFSFLLFGSLFPLEKCTQTEDGNR